jgi:hypothetical protein
VTRRAPAWLPALAAVLPLAALVPFAGAATLKGRVVGAGHEDGGRVTVPVLLSDKSAKAGKLTSAVVRLSLTGTARAGAAGGAVRWPSCASATPSASSSRPKPLRKAAYPKLEVTTLELTKRGARRWPSSPIA